MRALGFNVTLHRILAFGLAALRRGDRRGAVGLVQPPHHAGLDQPGADDRRPDHRGDRRPLPARGRLGRRADLSRCSTTTRASGRPTVGDVLGPERFNTILGVVFLRDRAAVARRPRSGCGKRRTRASSGGEDGGPPGRWRPHHRPVPRGDGTQLRRQNEVKRHEERRRTSEEQTVAGADRRHARAGPRRAGCGDDDDDDGGGGDTSRRAGRRRRRHDQGRLPVRLRGRLRLVLRADRPPASTRR